jgi:cell division protein FtsW (lipid II flippase)
MNTAKNTHQRNAISHSMWLLLLPPVPAILLGAFVMKAHALSNQTWAQHIAVGVCFLLAAALALQIRRSRPAVSMLILTTVLSIGLLAGTFFHNGIDGVHRWIKIGPVLLYASAAVLPIALLALGEKLNQSSHSIKIVFALTLTIALLLLMQPDTAQATAFAAGMLINLFVGSKQSMPRLLLIFILLVIAAATWIRPDPLAPVAHVEGILSMASQLGMAVQFFALLSLALVPLSIVLAARHGTAMPLFSVATYFVVYLAITQFRPFPVSFLGFGAAPIIGYYLFVVFLGLWQAEK